jgi:hypothetical protein
LKTGKKVAIIAVKTATKTKTPKDAKPNTKRDAPISAVSITFITLQAIIVATVETATQIAAIKKVVAAADKCEEALQ